MSNADPDIAVSDEFDAADIAVITDGLGDYDFGQTGYRDFRRLAVFVRLDSVGIFALIAGSYTPLAWNLMRGRWRVGTLATVWGTAAASIATAGLAFAS